MVGPGSHSYVASIQVAVAGMLCSLRSAHWAGGWRMRAVVRLSVVIWILRSYGVAVAVGGEAGSKRLPKPCRATADF